MCLQRKRLPLTVVSPSKTTKHQLYSLKLSPRRKPQRTALPSKYISRIQAHLSNLLVPSLQGGLTILPHQPPLQYLDLSRHQSSTLLQSSLRQLQIPLLTCLTYQQEVRLRDPSTVSHGRRLTHRDLLLQTFLTSQQVSMAAHVPGRLHPGTVAVLSGLYLQLLSLLGIRPPAIPQPTSPNPRQYRFERTRMMSSAQTVPTLITDQV